MIKRFLSTALVLLLALSLFPLSVNAEEFDLDLSTPPKISALEIFRENGAYRIRFKLKTPSSVRSQINMLEYFGYEDYISGLQMALSLENALWQEMDMSFTGEGSKWSGIWASGDINSLSENSWVQVKARYTGTDANGNPVLSDWSDVLTINEPTEEPVDEPSDETAEVLFDFNAHDWAKPELTEADGLGLIPAGLRTADLTQPITRAEFAAVSVKVYEALSGLKAEPAAENPFTDTSDPEVLKALNVGITNGLSETEFAPDKLLNREQAATMLSRVYKKVAFEGWTLGTDGDYAEAFRALFTMPEPFADDGDISAWARDSVYFMASNGILKGMEGGTFQPRAVTEEQQAAGYAQATREQAILIAVRLVKNLGG